MVCDETRDPFHWVICVTSNYNLLFLDSGLPTPSSVWIIVFLNSDMIMTIRTFSNYTDTLKKKFFFY